MTYKYSLTLKKDIEAKWLISTYIPLEGEPCYDTTNEVLKIGNGVDLFIDLSAITGGAGEVDLTGLATEIYVDGEIATLTNYVDGLPDNVGELIFKDFGYTVSSAEAVHKVAIGDGALDLSEPNYGYNTASGAYGSNSISLGYNTLATGNNSLSGGYGTAYGTMTTAGGEGSFSFGNSVVASGAYSHAEGVTTLASNLASHAEGADTTSSGYASHAEGYGSVASGENAHAEGQYSTASGYYSHAEGQNTTAIGRASHAEGFQTKAPNSYMHTAGKYNVGTAYDTIHETGIGASDIARANAFEIYLNGRLRAPELTIADIDRDTENSVAGYSARTLITKEYLDGAITAIPGGGASELEKVYDTNTYNTGWRILGELESNHIGMGSNAIDLSFGGVGETYRTSGASGNYSHAEGRFTRAEGQYAHAEGHYTTASGSYGSHAEGSHTTASGFTAHAEGYHTTAFNEAAHAEGLWTETNQIAMHAAGQYNLIKSVGANTIHQTGIGNGIASDPKEKANGFEIYLSGRVTAPELTPAIINSDTEGTDSGLSLQTLVTVEYLLSSEFGSRLPTVRPSAGKIWNNNGNLEVSSGGG